MTVLFSGRIKRPARGNGTESLWHVGRGSSVSPLDPGVVVFIQRGRRRRVPPQATICTPHSETPAHSETLSAEKTRSTSHYNLASPNTKFNETPGLPASRLRRLKHHQGGKEAESFSFDGALIPPPMERLQGKLSVSYLDDWSKVAGVLVLSGCRSGSRGPASTPAERVLCYSFVNEIRGDTLFRSKKKNIGGEMRQKDCFLNRL